MGQNRKPKDWVQLLRNSKNLILNIRKIRPLNYIAPNPLIYIPLLWRKEVCRDIAILSGNQKIWWRYAHKRWQQASWPGGRRVGEVKGAASPGSCPVPETRRKAQVVLPLVSYHMQYDFADSWILSYQWLLQVTLAEIGLWRCVSSQRNRRMGLGSQPHELLWVRLVQSCQKGRERVFKGSTKTANHSPPFHGKYEKKKANE